MDIKRRGMKKRTVEIPMKEMEGENSNTPPSDSWAWRKYGQKPIKGSPYPRGYYKCSSSKSCPARKQVERNRVDPTMLLVTYSSDHNHPSPPPRNHHNRNGNAATKSNKESDPGDDSLIIGDDQLGWLGGEVETIASAAVLESPVFSEQEVAMLGEEEESLFADLGELPECSVVFRRAVCVWDQC